MSKIIMLVFGIIVFYSTSAFAYKWEENWKFNYCPTCYNDKKIRNKNQHWYKHAGDDISYRRDGSKVAVGDNVYFRRSGKVKKVKNDSNGWGYYVVIESNSTTFVIHHLKDVKVKEGQDYTVRDDKGILLGKLIDLSSKGTTPHAHVGQRSEAYGNPDTNKLNIILKGALPPCKHKPNGLPQFSDKFKRPDSDLIRIFKN